MARQYRAFISVPLTAEDDDQAHEQAAKYAHMLIKDGAVVGHLELLGETPENSMTITRVITATPQLRKQLPADWR